MNPLTPLLKPSIFKLALAMSILAAATMLACTSDSATQEPGGEVSTADVECPDLEENPATAGGVPLGPPPSLPNIFTGTAYIDGKPVPAGEQLYVKLVTSRSRSTQIEQNGKFINIIHGPVSDLDKDVDFVFCLGDPEGRAVKSTETFEFKNEPFFERDVELNFPMLPSELNAQ